MALVSWIGPNDVYSENCDRCGKVEVFYECIGDGRVAKVVCRFCNNGEPVVEPHGIVLASGEDELYPESPASRYAEMIILKNKEIELLREKIGRLCRLHEDNANTINMLTGAEPDSEEIADNEI